MGGRSVHPEPVEGRTPRLLCVALLLLSCATPVKPDDSKPKLSSVPRKSATVFVAAELKGYLGPCGCSENMRGGIARAAFQLEQARAAGGKVALIDCGDSLFGTATISEDAVPQQERKARALADAFKKMGISTRAPGPLDDARGVHASPGHDHRIHAHASPQLR